MDIIDILYWTGLGFYILMVVASVYTVLFERRDPTRAFSWIVVIVLFPFVGLIFFLFFGQSYRKRKFLNLSGLHNLRRVEMLSQWQINNLESVDSSNFGAHPDIVKLLLHNSKSPLTTNNSIRILNNGEETFPSIFEAIESAKHHIHMEYYIIADDPLGERLSDVLCRKAREGVQVRVLFDDVGSWSLGRRYIKRLEESGVKVGSFGKVIFPYLTRKANYRNHRKIVVVDGRVGFMGGLNFAQKYLTGTARGIWRDTHMRMEGDVVRMLQITFLTDWYATTQQTFEDYSRYFPQPLSQGMVLPCQLALSGPDSEYATIMQCFFAAISRAKRYIYITTPYFLPSESLLTALKVAALSGVDVRVMLPSRSDATMVHWASRSYFSELLAANIKIYLYTKGFNHSKVMVIDDTFTSIGSANMDARSLEDNFEITAMIYHSETAVGVRDTYCLDIADCELLTSSGWASRKRKDNFKEAAARLFSPLL